MSAPAAAPARRRRRPAAPGRRHRRLRWLPVAGLAPAVAALILVMPAGRSTAAAPSAVCPPGGAPMSSTGGPVSLNGGSSSGQGIAGYTLTALAAGLRYAVDSPGLLPVGDPSQGNVAELDVPFARETVSEGPLVDSLGSPAYPGDTAASLGTAIGTFGGPDLPNDPVLARASYPPSPGRGPTSQFPPGGEGGPGNAGNAQAAANTGGGTAQSSVASATLGSGASALTAGPSQTGSVVDLSSSCVDTQAVASAGEIDIAGLVKIAGVRGLAMARSDGSKAVPQAELTLGDVTVAGQRAYIDRNGIHLANQSAGGQAVSAAQSALQALSAAGIGVKVVSPLAIVKGADGTADSGGLEVTLDRQIGTAGLPGGSISVPGVPALPSVPLHVEVVYGTARAEANATTGGAGLLGAVVPFTPSAGGTTASAPATGATAGPAAASGGAAASTGSTLGVSPGLSGMAGPAPSGPGSENLVANSAPPPGRGPPVPVGWAVGGVLASIVAAGPLFGYARWQLLAGRV